MVWILSAIISLIVAAKTKIGPTVVQLSSNHGIHAGDVVAVGGAVVFSALFTLVVWRLGDRRRGSDRSLGQDATTPAR